MRAHAEDRRAGLDSNSMTQHPQRRTTCQSAERRERDSLRTHNVHKLSRTLRSGETGRQSPQHLIGKLAGLSVRV